MYKRQAYKGQSPNDRLGVLLDVLEASMMDISEVPEQKCYLNFVGCSALIFVDGHGSLRTGSDVMPGCMRATKRSAILVNRDARHRDLLETET